MVLIVNTNIITISPFNTQKTPAETADVLVPYKTTRLFPEWKSNETFNTVIISYIRLNATDFQKKIKKQSIFCHSTARKGIKVSGQPHEGIHKKSPPKRA
jgi:hypothetical protein